MNETGAAALRTALRISGWCALLPLATAIISGAVLCWYFVPSAALAHASIVDLEAVAPLARVARALHFLSAQLALVAGLAHLVIVLLRAEPARGQRPHGWRSGLLALGLLGAVAFAGRVLPWDQHGATSLTMATSLLGVAPAGTPALAVDGMDARLLQRVLFVHLAGVVLLAAVLHVHGATRALRGPLARPRPLAVAAALALLLLGAAVISAPAPLGRAQSADELARAAGSAQWYLRWLQCAALHGVGTARAVIVGLVALVLATPLLSRAVSPRAPRIVWAAALAGAVVASVVPC